MSGGRAKRRKQKAWRQHQKNKTSLSPNCPKCGQPGPHFVPPSFGDKGFFLCQPQTSLVREVLPEQWKVHYRTLAGYETTAYLEVTDPDAPNQRGANKHSDTPVTVRWSDEDDIWIELNEEN